MSENVYKLGDNWTKNIEAPAFDIEVNYQAFDAITDSRESAADNMVTEYIHASIPDGILSCVSRGSNSLILPVSVDVLETQAFERLRKWLADQRLRMAITGFRAENGMQALLGIMPEPEGG